MRGLHLLVYPLYFCSGSLLRTVDCDTFTPTLWKSLLLFYGSFFTAITMFLSSTADVFLGLPVWDLLLSTPVVSFFLRTFLMVVLALADVCAMALIDFPSSPFLVFHVSYTSNYQWFFTGKIWNWAQTFSDIYCLINQCNITHQGNKTHWSVMFKYFW